MKISKNAIVASIGSIAVVAAVVWLFIGDGYIMEQEALQKVKALPEVQEFIAELEANEKNTSFNIEDRGDSWGVQVYEIVVQNGESHTATFNWYIIDKKTGAVTKEFE